MVRTRRGRDWALNPARYTLAQVAERLRRHPLGEEAGSRGGGVRLCGFPVPGQQIGDLAGRMIGDAGEHVGEILLRVEAAELCRFDQRIESRCTAAAGVGAGEQVIFAADRDERRARSAGLLSRASRPSSRHRSSAFQRDRI